MGFSKDKPHVLKEHPGAYWRGGADGGQFVEITQAEPTYYFYRFVMEMASCGTKGG
jgi:hypothetical protein